MIQTITVCQAGYDLLDSKRAVVVAKGEGLSNLEICLIRTADEQVVFKGKMFPCKPEGFTRDESYYLFDFSDVKESGEYLISSQGVRSYPFIIEEGLWKNYVSEVIGYYRIQRCGEDTRKCLPKSGFANQPDGEALHGPCHMNDARVGFPDGPFVDCVGGWHDAGDNNKYNSQFGWLAADFVSIYERHPKATFDLDGNGIPDLLDEARVAAEYLLKVQKASNHEGALLDQVQNHGKCCAWLHPSKEMDDRVLECRVTSKNPNPPLYPYDTAMKAAAGLAAVARAFKPFDDSFARECEEGAKKAYAWAVKHPECVGGSYCTNVQESARLLAAVELFLLTGEGEYETFVTDYIDNCSAILKRGTNYWGVDPLALTDYYPVSGSRKEKILSLLREAATDWSEDLLDPFGVSSELTGCNFGVNEPNMSKAADAYRLYELTGDLSLKTAAERAMEWTFGVNPFNCCFVAGVGYSYPVRIHSRLDEDAETNPESRIYLPGFMVCGPIAHDTQNEKSECPWYEDRPLTQDPLQQWRYNEHSVSIQAACLELVVSMAYRNR